MGDKPSQWGTYDPYWNFTDKGARDFWLNNFTQQVCDERAVSGATVDNWCGFWGGATHGGCFFDNATQIEQVRASYSLYRLMVEKLNGCGIVPIMATFSALSGSIGGGIDPTDPCVVWEDELVAALDGLHAVGCGSTSSGPTSSTCGPPGSQGARRSTGLPRSSRTASSKPRPESPWSRM